MKGTKFIEIEKIKGYEKRTLLESKHADYRGRVSRMVHDEPAIYIRVRNSTSENINVTLNILIEDKYGVIGNLSPKKNNLRPNEPYEFFISRNKKQNLKLLSASIEKKSGNDTDEIEKELPKGSGIKLKIWLISSVMIYFLGSYWYKGKTTGYLASSNTAFIDIGDYQKFLQPAILFFLFLITMVSIVGRATLTIGMLAVLVLILLFQAELFFKIKMLLLGTGFLYIVWTRRYSIRDFLSWT